MKAVIAAARRHRAQFEAYVQAAGRFVVVRQPAVAAAVGSAVTRALGPPTTAEGPVGRTDEVWAICSYNYAANLNPFAGTASLPPRLQALGAAENLDMVLRCPLQSVLLAGDGSRTLFDTAKDVIIDGQSFKVIATDRSGLPPEPAYICWVALKKNGVAS